MRNDSILLPALTMGSLLILCCGGQSGVPPTDQTGPDAGNLQDSGGTSPGVDIALSCCPVGFDLYACEQASGTPGLACHNPALGCASSQICGQGCDPEVTGRCACVQTELCILGDHFDTTLCNCVANPVCIDNVLCIRGDHFDTTLCKCVPDN